MSADAGDTAIADMAGDATETEDAAAEVAADVSAVDVEADVAPDVVTPPNITGLLPATGLVQAAPTSVSVTFDKAMNALDASAFTISGSCATLPTAGALAMGEDAKAATLTLVGGTCADAETLTIAADPVKTADATGMAGVGSPVSATYTIDAAGPVVTFAAVDSPVSHLSMKTVVSFKLGLTDACIGGAVLTSALTAEGGGLTVTTASGDASCAFTVEVANSVVKLGNCTGTGSVSFHANAGVAQDTFGNLSLQSAESEAFTVLAVAPTLVQSTPASGSTFSSIPASVDLKFSAAVTLSDGAVSVSAGTCAAPPTLGGLTGNGTATINAALTGGNCTGTQSFGLVIAMPKVADIDGNTGSGEASVSFTHAKPIKKLFITAAAYTGNLGGMAGADAKCQSDANKPADSSTYKAVLADETTRQASPAQNWVLLANAGYVRPDGTLIGETDSTMLFSFMGFNNPMSADNVSLWIGFYSGWSTAAGYTCTNWTATTGLGSNGKSSATMPGGVYGGYGSCSDAKSLICAEQ
ncbi:MAG: DUF1554 domain-containing protein [Myxococcota bacterium]